MIDKDKILEIVKQKGPLIPRDLVKEVGRDTFFTGAVLSQLVDTKELKISYAKIGGSPVYYVTGQEAGLEKLYPYLNEKDKKAYDLLKERKVVRDNECEPLLRVAFRSIKDFAKPLEVTISQNKEIFWKWHIITNQEAEELIKKILIPEAEKEKPEIKKEEKKEKEVVTQEKAQEIKEVQKEQTKETQKEITKKPVKEKEKPKEEQEKLTEEPSDSFYENIKKRLLEKKIQIIEAKIIKKNSDIEMLLKVPSEVGKINFYCRAKDKKKTSDKDLSLLYVEAQVKKMPVLYVVTGELSKKAEQMLKEEFKIITVLKI